MLVRIVKMEFDPKKVEQFLEIFESSKHKISSQPGCTHLKLLRQSSPNNVFFTYSHWQHEDYLNQYRNSELFGKVWKSTKALFNAKPQAWSVNEEWCNENKVSV